MSEGGLFMRRYWQIRALGYLAVALVVGGPLILSAPVMAEVATGRVVTVSGERAEQQFLAGERVTIGANVADDVFAAGQTVTVENARGHVLVGAASRLEMRNSTVRDLIAAALDAEIGGMIEDDAVAAVCPICWWSTGRLLVTKDARIGDDARLAAGTLEIEGQIGDELHAAARRVVISGNIGGKAEIRAEEIVIAAGARIGGELVARSPRPPQIVSGATVAGQVRHIETDVDLPEPSKLARGLVWFAVFAAIAILLGLVVFGILAQLVMPGFLQGSVARLRAQPWGSIGLGLAVALLGPAVAALLFVLVIGIPAGVVTLAAFVVVAALALVTAGYGLGLWLRDRTGRGGEIGTGGRVGWTSLGLIGLVLVNIIPIVGWIVALLAFLAGLGAVTGTLAGRMRAEAT
jgi:hypothetical protein